MPFYNKGGLSYKKKSDPKVYQEAIENYAQQPQPQYNQVQSEEDPVKKYAEQGLMQAMQPQEKPHFTDLADVVGAFGNGYKNNDGGKVEKILSSIASGIPEAAKFAGTSEGLNTISLIAHLIGGGETGLAFNYAADGAKADEQREVDLYNESEKDRKKMLSDLYPTLGNQQIQRDKLNENKRQFDVGFDYDTYRDDVKDTQWGQNFDLNVEKLGFLNDKFNYQQRQDAIENDFREDKLSSNEKMFYDKLNFEKEYKNQQKLVKQMEKTEGVNATVKSLEAFADSMADVYEPFTIAGVKITEPFRMAGRFLSAGGNENEVSFQSRRNSLIMNIARNLGGEKGPLTKEDLKVVEKYIPGFADSKVQKAAKMRAVLTLINSKMQASGFNKLPEDTFTNRIENNINIEEVK